VEKVCNRAIILSQGRILVDSTPGELQAQAPGHDAVRITLAHAADLEPLRARLAGEPWCREVEIGGDSVLEVRPMPGANALLELPRCLAGVEVVGLHQREGRLDDVFRAVTKGVAA
jgi:ABC-2 type transport system ATP-binding protein